MKRNLKFSILSIVPLLTILLSFQNCGKGIQAKDHLSETDGYAEFKEDDPTFSTAGFTVYTLEIAVRSSGGTVRVGYTVPPTSYSSTPRNYYRDIPANSGDIAIRNIMKDTSVKFWIEPNSGYEFSSFSNSDGDCDNNLKNVDNITLTSFRMTHATGCGLEFKRPSTTSTVEYKGTYISGTQAHSDVAIPDPSWADFKFRNDGTKAWQAGVVYMKCYADYDWTLEMVQTEFPDGSILPGQTKRIRPVFIPRDHLGSSGTIVEAFYSCSLQFPGDKSLSTEFLWFNLYKP